MSEKGQTETSARLNGMSGPPPIADVIRLHAQVRFAPIASLCTAASACLLARLPDTLINYPTGRSSYR